jgi:hypothetical protein
VIHWKLRSNLDGTTIVLATGGRDNIPTMLRAHETYKILGVDEFVEV